MNEIYWGPNYEASYSNGSVIKVNKFDEIDFTNRFTPSGDGIMQWGASSNYQGDKSVAGLPHLQNGHRYRIVAHYKTTPHRTIIMRLIFRDIQGQEIKRYNLTNTNSYFTVPKETINYELLLVNAGCINLKFQRLEICLDNVDKQANKDLWFQQKFNEQVSTPINIMVIPSGKWVRKSYPELSYMIGDLSVQPVNVSWQYKGNLTDDLLKWVDQHDVYDAHIISCDPEVDQAIIKMKEQVPTLEVLVTSKHQAMAEEIDGYVYQYQPAADWANRNIVEPNFENIVPHMRLLWGSE